MKPLLSMTAMTLLASLSASAYAGNSPINIVAGENFYGDLAQQLGGPHDAKGHFTAVKNKSDQITGYSLIRLP